MNKFNMSDNIHFIDMAEEKIKQGVIVGLGISTTGYLIYSIVDTNNKLHNREENYVFETEVEAVPVSEEFFKIKKDMKKIAKTSGDKIDTMRKAIIGEPRLEQYVPKVN